MAGKDRRIRTDQDGAYKLVFDDDRVLAWAKQILWPWLKEKETDSRESKPMNPEEEFSMLTQTVIREMAEIKEKGRAKGNAEGKIELILYFLSTRLGPVDPSLEQLLQEVSDPRELNELATCAANCTSIEEFSSRLNK